MAVYVYAGKIVRRGSGYLSTDSGFVDIPGPAGATTLSLSWNLPIANEDGSTPISPAITWQRIRYDTSSKSPLGGYAYVKYINSGSTTSVSISSLASNTYYCVHETYNGLAWSESSNEFPKASA